MLPVRFITSILLLFAADCARAAADNWENMGPRGGRIFCAAVHPASEDTIYAGLEDGAYRSSDGGESWAKLSQIPSYTFDIVFHSQNPHVIYALSGGKLHKSSDSGENWAQLSSLPGRSFLMDPVRPNRLYMGSSMSVYTYDAVIFVSADGGATWTESSLGGEVAVASIAADPSDSNVVYAGTTGDWDFPGSGVYKSFDGGLTWENYSSGLPYSNIECLEIDPSDPLILYAGTSGGGEYGADGVYKTTNGGVTWEAANTGLPMHAGILTLRVHPSRTEIVYAGRWKQLYRSEDRGRSWLPVDTGMEHGELNSIEFFRKDADIMYFGSGLGVLRHDSNADAFTQMGITTLAVTSVVVDHADPRTIYATGQSTFKSTDSGAHWRPINAGLPKGQVITQDPADREVLYLGSYSPTGAVYKTTDGGEKWRATSLIDVSINDIAVAASDPNIVFAGGLEDPFVGGIFKSENAGDTWKTVDNTQASCIAIDPTDAASVYVGSHTGMLKTVDGGKTWFRIEEGLDLPASGYVLAVAIDPHFTNVVYCGTINAGVFKSVDSGAHWVNMSEGIDSTLTGRKDIRALIVDPTDANVLYAGAWGTGVFVTGDGGLAWYRLGGASGTGYGVSLALDPENPGIVYSAGGPYSSGGGLWRYSRTSSPAPPEIISYDPASVLPDNCAEGCVVSFDVGAPGGIGSEVASVTLERRLGKGWIQEDRILAPIPEPVWRLICAFDEHFTDGEHVFRAVVRCEDGGSAASEPVVVTADRGIPVTISAFEAGYSEGRVTLRWALAGSGSFLGFNVYRSLEGAAGFIRLNGTLIPGDREFQYVDDSVQPGRTYWYRLGITDANGEWLSEVSTVSVPAFALSLFQNRPNPFNPETVISFSLPGRMKTTLTIYNVEGQRVATLVDDTLDGGLKQVAWRGEDSLGNPVTSGVYFYRLSAGGRVITKKMVLLK
jgi:photosystem II stability/assembly factor-like uncharacterized protein